MWNSLRTSAHPVTTALRDDHTARGEGSDLAQGMKIRGGVGMWIQGSAPNPSLSLNLSFFPSSHPSLFTLDDRVPCRAAHFLGGLGQEVAAEIKGECTSAWWTEAVVTVLPGVIFAPLYLSQKWGVWGGNDER